jgi:hypothetical protein
MQVPTLSFWRGIVQDRGRHLAIDVCILVCLVYGVDNRAGGGVDADFFFSGWEGHGEWGGVLGDGASGRWFYTKGLKRTSTSSYLRHGQVRWVGVSIWALVSIPKA